MEKKTKLTISGSAKKSIKNIEIAKSKGKNSVLIEKQTPPDWYLDEVEISEIVDYANEGNKSLQIQLKKLKLMYNLIKESNW